MRKVFTLALLLYASTAFAMSSGGSFGNAGLTGTPCSSLVTEAAHTCKVGGGVVYNTEATTGIIPGWVVVLDSPNLPKNGDTLTPLKCRYLAASSSQVLINEPIPFKYGLTIGFTLNGCYSFKGSPTTFLSTDYR